MDMTAAASKDVTDAKPAAGFFGSPAWRIIRNSLVGLLATLFVIWLVLFVTKGRFLKHPFESVTTVTRQIVDLITGEQEFNSVKTLSAFALGLVLFLITLLLNLIALRIVRRFQEQYE